MKHLNTGAVKSADADVFSRPQKCSHSAHVLVGHHLKAPHIRNLNTVMEHAVVKLHPPDLL